MFTTALRFGKYTKEITTKYEKIKEKHLKLGLHVSFIPNTNSPSEIHEYIVRMSFSCLYK